MKSNTNLGKSAVGRNNNGKWDQVLAKVIRPAQLGPWREPGVSTVRVAWAGLWLGALAGCVSLLANVIGSVAWPAIVDNPQHPLRLIQVYLTFPFGESALELSSGRILALGCILYLVTGMLYGMLFELAVSYVVPRAGTAVRLGVCCGLAILVWLVNFYGILSWLQPLVSGGSWILDLVPWWVAAATHLLYGGTMALIYPLGVQR